VFISDLSESVKPIEDLSAEIEEIENDEPKTEQPEAVTTAPVEESITTSSEPIVKPNSNFKFTPITFDKPATTTTPTATKELPVPAKSTVPAATSPASQHITETADAKVKSIDDAEKALERAKRFGIQLNEKAKQDIRAQRFGIANKASSTNTATTKTTANTTSKAATAKKAGIDPEVLKKRAERFGITSSAATVASAKGKVPVKFDAAEEEKKRKRAERFNASTEESANKKQKAE
jgi:SAP domain-containing ribonucleoprotein